MSPSRVLSCVRSVIPILTSGDGSLRMLADFGIPERRGQEASYACAQGHVYVRLIYIYLLHNMAWKENRLCFLDPSCGFCSPTRKTTCASRILLSKLQDRRMS